MVSGKNVEINGEDAEMASHELWKLLPFDLPSSALELTIFLAPKAAAVFNFTCYMVMKE